MEEVKTYRFPSGTVRVHGADRLTRGRVEPALARYLNKISFKKEKKDAA